MNCKFCNKECKNQNSLRNHERLCKLNPNHQIIKSWNKGLTKETDERVAKQSRTSIANYKNGNKVSYRKGKTGTFKGKHHTEETKRKISQTMIAKGYGGVNSRGLIKYKNVYLDSKYELIVAESLDENNIKWERGKRFPYHNPKDEIHYYTPDFYLPEYNVYLEPKNDFLINNDNPYYHYKDVDKVAWTEKENDIKVIILDKEHLTWNKIKELL